MSSLRHSFEGCGLGLDILTLVSEVLVSAFDTFVQAGPPSGPDWAGPENQWDRLAHHNDNNDNWPGQAGLGWAAKMMSDDRQGWAWK